MSIIYLKKESYKEGFCKLELNQQHLEFESNALPIELLRYSL